MELHHCDCLEKIPTLPEGSVDAVIADIPYGTTQCKWDVVIPFDQMWNCIQHVVKKDAAIVLFGSEPFSSLLRTSNLKNFKYDWIWEKSCPSGMPSADYMPMKYHEIISVFCYSGKTTFNKQLISRAETGAKVVKGYIDKGTTFKKGATDHQEGSKLVEYSANKYDPATKNPSSILRIASERPRPRLHPTQKPVALMEYLVKTYTNEGEIILDFTMGSGTTGAACLNLSRNFIGIEKDKTYFDIAKERLEKIILD